MGGPRKGAYLLYAKGTEHVKDQSANWEPMFLPEHANERTYCGKKYKKT